MKTIVRNGLWAIGVASVVTSLGFAGERDALMRALPSNRSIDFNVKPKMPTLDKDFVIQAKDAIQSKVSTEGGGSSGVGGGGDLCEDRIKIVRADLKNWIADGGPSGLTLPAGISVDQYSKSMLKSIDQARIKCVGPGDQGFPVTVNGTPKVCRFDSQENLSQISCDFSKFQSTNESDQYTLVHHEYAGISGFEAPKKDDSNYDISNQISGYLVDTIVKKLAVRPNQNPVPPSLSNGFLFVKSSLAVTDASEYDSINVARCIAFSGIRCINFDEYHYTRLNQEESLPPGIYFASQERLPFYDNKFEIKAGTVTTLQMTTVSPADIIKFVPAAKYYFKESHRYRFSLSLDYSVSDYRSQLEINDRKRYAEFLAGRAQYSAFCDKNRRQRDLSYTDLLQAKSVLVCDPSDKFDTIRTYTVKISPDAQKFLDTLPLDPNLGFYLGDYLNGRAKFDDMVIFTDDAHRMFNVEMQPHIFKRDDQGKINRDWEEKFILNDDLSVKIAALLPGHYVIVIRDLNDEEPIDTVHFTVK